VTNTAPDCPKPSTPWPSWRRVNSLGGPTRRALAVESRVDDRSTADTAVAGRPVPGEPSGPAVPYPRCPAAGRARHRRGCHRGQRSRRKDCSSVAGRCRWGCSC